MLGTVVVESSLGVTVSGDFFICAAVTCCGSHLQESKTQLRYLALSGVIIQGSAFIESLHESLKANNQESISQQLLL